MKIKNQQNRTTFIRRPKDEQYPFSRIPANLFKLNGYQFAIMAFILSNKGDSENPTKKDWNIVKYEIGNRLGFPRKKFQNAWKSLVDLGYIQLKRLWGGYDYTVYEDPSYTSTAGGICEDITSTTGTTCTGGILTTTNNNYYNTVFEEAVRTVTTTKTRKPRKVSSTVENIHFNELKELYPSYINRSDGIRDYLKTDIKRCEKLYTNYLKEGLEKTLSHNDVIDCLKAELNERENTGKMKYIKKFVKWLEAREWEGYKDKFTVTTNMRYGTDIY
jgi:hypothetical protein